MASIDSIYLDRVDGFGGCADETGLPVTRGVAEVVGDRSTSLMASSFTLLADMAGLAFGVYSEAGTCTFPVSWVSLPLTQHARQKYLPRRPI